MKKNRILGMTAFQLALLACLTCLAAGVVGGGGWMVYNGEIPGFGPVPATRTPVPPATATLAPTATETLTPTPTEIPYETFVPPGWQRFVNDNVEIWMPLEFPVESNDEYNAAMARGLKELGQGDLALQYEVDPPVYELNFHKLTLDHKLETSVYLKQDPIGSLELSGYVEDRFEELPITFTFVERRDFEMYRARAVRVMLQANFNSSYVGYVYYLVRDGDVVWEIGCHAGLDDFYTLLPTFDKMAGSFRPAE
jgi:hypothetical protein